jgi:SAM-dependent methyltransferase
MSHPTDILNRRANGRGVAIEAYPSAADLSIAERAIFQKLSPRLAGKRLLDIGVGGGRTTAFMLDLSRDYTAIDHCEGLVDVVKAKFRLDSVYYCDVCDMRRFADGTFDFALFSFNGLDYVSHEDRLKALGEINRVLADDGLFVFSSHNRNRINGRSKSSRSLPHEGIGTGTRFRHSLKSVLLTPRHWLKQRHETKTPEYAIINDDGPRYSLLTYYITPLRQVAQLESLRFAVESIYNFAGHAARTDDQSPWLYYLSSKRSSASEMAYLAR